MNTDAICGALSVCEDSEILMITSKGQAVRCPVLNIRETNRGSKGVKLVNLTDKDKLIGISEVVELDEETLPDEEESEDVNEGTKEITPSDSEETESPIVEDEETLSDEEESEDEETLPDDQEGETE